jgi:pilus assembly protein Flp/PilA
MLPRRFVADESGATAVEYGLLCALLAVAISAVISDLGASLLGALNQLVVALK